MLGKGRESIEAKWGLQAMKCPTRAIVISSVMVGKKALSNGRNAHAQIVSETNKYANDRGRLCHGWFN